MRLRKRGSFATAPEETAIRSVSGLPDDFGQSPWWRVYGGQPLPRDFASERAARRFARKLGRLGMTADLYSAERRGDWKLRERMGRGEAARYAGTEGSAS